MARLSIENRVVLVTFYSFVMVFGISGNSCVIYSLVFSKANRKNIHNSYLLALSIADILYSLMYPSHMLPGLSNPELNDRDEVFCKIMTFLTYDVACAGLLAITVLSLDRYFAIRYPLVHHWRKGSRVTLFVILLVYISPLACFCPLLAAEEWVECSEASGGVNWHKIPMAYVCSLVFLLFIVPGVILAVTNVYVYIFTRKRHLNCHRQPLQMMKMSRSQFVKQNQVSDENRMHLAHEENAVLGGSRNNLCNESGSNSSTNVHSCENVMHNQNADVAAHTHDSTDILKFRTTGFENRVSLQSIRCHRDPNTAIASEHLKFASLEQHSSAGYRIHERSLEASRKQLKERRMQKDMKIAMMTVALVVSFFITWLPFLVCRLVCFFNKISLGPTTRFYTAAFTAVNSVINPYLILATRKDIREVLLRRQQTC